MSQPSHGRTENASPAPNILWLVTTQWRAQAFGYAGDPNARTPNLDAFSAAGTNYSQAVTPHPFGPFARAALLTGVPCPANGVRDYFDPPPTGTKTVADAMRQRGYETAYFGKWHLARRDPAAPLVGDAHARMIVPPEMRGGFDFWEGFESGFLLNDPWVHGTEMPEPVQLPGYQPVVLAERFEEWRRGRRSDARPWFCVFSVETPHPPYAAPADGEPPLEPGAIVLPRNVPRGGDVEARARSELAGYYAHVAATDRALGRLLTRLSDRAPRRPTIVVFTSVHGDMHGAHGLFRKGWPHEESVRVPLLVGRLGESALGRVDYAAVSLVDLPAMTLRWVDGIPAAAPAVAASISMPSVVALPHQCDRAWSGMRTARRKLILNADHSPWLYYDLERDPGEEQNLASDPARVAEIKAWRDHGTVPA